MHPPNKYIRRCVFKMPKNHKYQCPKHGCKFQPHINLWYCHYHDGHASDRCHVLIKYAGLGAQCDRLGVDDEESGKKLCEQHALSLKKTDWDAVREEEGDGDTRRISVIIETVGADAESGDVQVQVSQRDDGDLVKADDDDVDEDADDDAETAVKVQEEMIMRADSVRSPSLSSVEEWRVDEDLKTVVEEEELIQRTDLIGCSSSLLEEYFSEAEAEAAKAGSSSPPLEEHFAEADAETFSTVEEELTPRADSVHSPSLPQEESLVDLHAERFDAQEHEVAQHGCSVRSSSPPLEHYVLDDADTKSVEVDEIIVHPPSLPLEESTQINKDLRMVDVLDVESIDKEERELVLLIDPVQTSSPPLKECTLIDAHNKTVDVNDNTVQAPSPLLEESILADIEPGTIDAVDQGVQQTDSSPSQHSTLIGKRVNIEVHQTDLVHSPSPPPEECALFDTDIKPVIIDDQEIQQTDLVRSPSPPPEEYDVPNADTQTVTKVTVIKELETQLTDPADSASQSHTFWNRLKILFPSEADINEKRARGEDTAELEKYVSQNLYVEHDPHQQLDTPKNPEKPVSPYCYFGYTDSQGIATGFLAAVEPKVYSYNDIPHRDRASLNTILDSLSSSPFGNVHMSLRQVLKKLRPPPLHYATPHRKCCVCLEKHDEAVMLRVPECRHRYRELCVWRLVKAGETRSFNCRGCAEWLDSMGEGD